MNYFKLSVIVPVYNVENYLIECVESLLNVSINKEILLIDDGSTDSSAHLCDQLSNKYQEIKTFHKVNGGLSSARNYGINKATGDYIMFVDSDDYLLKEETEKLLSFDKEIHPDLVMGLYNDFYENGETKHEKCDAFLSMGNHISINDFLRCTPTDGVNCILTAWRFIIKREFLMA